MRWHRHKCENCHKIQFQMYIIACRAHFCHLLGLDQVGHSPRGTNGSTGTLDWGPMWSDSHSTCYPNTSLTPLHPLMPPNGPQHHTPRSPQCSLMPLRLLLAPEYLQSLSAPNTLQTPYTPDTPDAPKQSLHPYTPQEFPMPPIPLLALEYLESLPALIHP